MKGKSARLIFLAICIVLAALLLFQVIRPLTGGAVFAVALVLFGGLSRGFRK